MVSPQRHGVRGAFAPRLSRNPTDSSQVKICDSSPAARAVDLLRLESHEISVG
jgi:hypothetical protein